MEPLEIINANMPLNHKIDTLAEPSTLGRHVLQVLVDKIPASMVVETIQSLLTATRATKHGEVADTRSQEAGVKLWLAYTVGLPIQRQEIHQTVINKTEEETMRTLKSPAMLAAMKRMIAGAEGGEGGEG